MANYRQAVALRVLGEKLPKPKDKEKTLRITPKFPAELRKKLHELTSISTKERSNLKAAGVRTKIVANSLYVNGQKYNDKLPYSSPHELP